MKWTAEKPTTESFSAGEAYYWFCGLPFNKPIVVCLHKCSGIKPTPWQDLNADFPHHEPFLRSEHWPSGEWFGPLSAPE